MIRDRQPRYQLGNGVNSGDIDQGRVEEGTNPDSSFISKALDGHPVMRFFATMGATIVAAHVAGKLVKDGGVKLIKTVSERSAGKPFFTGLVSEFRDIQHLFDDAEGLARTSKGGFKYGEDGFKLDSFTDDLTSKAARKGFWWQDGKNVRPEEEWLVRDEVQQRLVNQARRLPYELPAAYLAQRAVINPLLGQDNDDVKWYNPIDVIGDFADQSIKNAASMFAFEGIAGAAIGQSNRLRFPNLSPGTLKPWENKASDVFVGLDSSLKLIGQRSTDVLYQASKYSNLVGRSFSAGIQEVVDNNRSTFERLQALKKQGIQAARTGDASAEMAGRLATNIPGLPGQVVPFIKGFRNKWTKTSREIAEQEKNLRSFLGTGQGNTLIEHWADSFEEILGKSGHLEDSKFAGAQRSSEYQQLIRDELVNNYGIGKDEAEEFLRRTKLATPSIRKGVEPNLNPRSIQDVVRSVGDDFFPGQVKNDQDLINAIAPRLRNIKGGDTIAKNLGKVIRTADTKYNANYDAIYSRINQKWYEATNLLGQEANKTFRQRKIPFAAAHSGMAKDTQNYMTRRAGHALGLDVDGMNLGDIRKALGQRGINADNAGGLRNFLINSGVVEKPGKSGYNLFGLRKLSVEDALSKGFFGDPKTSRTAARIQQISHMIAPFHEGIAPNLRGTTFGHVYETADGRVINFAGPIRSIRKAVDTLATETQLPVIKTKVLNLFFYKALQGMRETPAIQIATGAHGNPFLPKIPGQDINDSLIWFKNKGTKGRLHRVMGGDGDVATHHAYEGTYRAPRTDSTSVFGQIVRLAAGERGMIPDHPATGLKKAFDVDEHQQDSVFRMFKRFRDRKNDLRNLPTFARLAKAKQLNIDSNMPEVAQGMQGLIKRLRNFGFSRNVVSKMGDISVGGHSLQNIADTADEDLYALISKMNEQELKDIAKLGPKEASLSKRKALQTNYLQSIVSRKQQLDTVAAEAGTSTYIHKEIDKARQEMYQYIILRQGLESSGRTVNQNFGDILGNLTKLRSEGKISSKELSEARAGLLSTQLNFVGLDTPGASLQSRLIYQARKLTTDPFATAEVLDDLATGKDASFGTVGAFLKRTWGFSQYQYPGVQYNPFGASTTFVPTFGTAFKRNPYGAVKSVLGIGTRRNPQAFSGMSVPMEHGIRRLNSFFSAFGMGVDESKYSGPLSQFAIGYVGKRILPMYAGAAILNQTDRTLGGIVYGKDKYGNRQYKPLVGGLIAKGIAGAQIGLAGLIPGGKTDEEKRDELYNGEVPVRKGRFWLLGQTPFKGGNEMYFRPSWYKRYTSGYQYDDQTGWKSPMEKLLYGYDFSPLRPLDPYRYERKTYNTRPYPVTGQYFTGPWGPLTSVLNSTIGRVLKPRARMHRSEVADELAHGYSPYGQYGAVPTYGASNAQYAAAGGSVGNYGTRTAFGALAAQNRGIEGAGAKVGSSAAKMTRSSLAHSNSRYEQAGSSPTYTGASSIGLVPNLPAVTPGSPRVSAGQFGYETQEMLGIYGFLGGSVRSALGVGNQDFTTPRPILASADLAYGTSRSFWDFNLGGLGDSPALTETGGSNLELSEIVRRFIPRPRRLNTINPIRNDLGKMYPWLPGDGALTNFQRGDPYAAIPEGEMRLPGSGYETLHQLHSDQSGKYGALDRFQILGDIAPYSDEFQRMEKSIQGKTTEDAYVDNQIQQTITQAEAVRQKHDFTDYPTHPYSLTQWLKHRDTYINRKFLPNRTATEDWERNNVYGVEFAEWQHPIQDFLEPMLYKGTNRNPIVSAVTLGAVGAMFGANARMRAIGSFIGAAVGFGAGMMRGSFEATGNGRFVPEKRQKELAIEEYSDILSYTKARHQYATAQSSGDALGEQNALRQLQSTMYGADLYNSTAEQLSMAIPTRKREHFMKMITAPEKERNRILSTAGRLERRVYEAAWGMPVEKRPDLSDYYQQHELPASDSSFWDSPDDMESVKIKVLQSLDLNPKHLGFYPQQIEKANLVNPVYPDFNQHSSRRGVEAELQKLMAANNMQGTITRQRTAYSGNQVQLYSGVGY